MNNENQPSPASQPRKCSGFLPLLIRSISFKLVLVVALAIAISPLVVSAYRTMRTIFAWERIEKATLSVLRSENLVFLVTDKIVSQIAVDIRDSSLLLGKREGVLISTVTMYYGVDLKQLDESCFSRIGNTLVVKLPDPRELDFTVDLGSLKYLTKRSGLNVIADFLCNKDLDEELRQGIHNHAATFMTDKKLLPTRDKIVKQLNAFAAPLFQEKGVTIEFR
jgi:hypothetical protein